MVFVAQENTSNTIRVRAPLVQLGLKLRVFAFVL